MNKQEKETQDQIIISFLLGKELRIGKYYTDGEKIYYRDKNKLELSLCVSRSSEGIILQTSSFSDNIKRLFNLLPFVKVTQKNFKWYLNGEEWDGKPRHTPGVIFN